MDNSLHIIGLEAENVKRLVAVSITPNPDASLVIIGGNNGSGKTSTLQCIEFALAGKGAQKDTPRPIRDGESGAYVILNFGEYVVEVRWTLSSQRLVLRREDGSTVSSPQAILDALTGEMAFDPLQFTHVRPRDRREMVLRLIDLPFDLDQLADEDKATREQRRDAARDLKAVEARLVGLAVVDVPASAMSIADAMQAHRAAATQKFENQQTRVALHRATVKQSESEEALNIAKAAVEAAEAILLEANANAATCVAAFNALEPDPDVDALAEQVAQAEHWAAMRAQHQRASELETERQQLERQVLDCEAHIAGIEQTKRDGLANAVMPVPGLSIDDNDITYLDRPFSQASAAEQLRVSTAIAMAGDPRIRVMLIHDGSLLDDDNLAMLEQMAADNDFQVWVERVGKSDPSAIIIEDGEVVS